MQKLPKQMMHHQEMPRTLGDLPKILDHNTRTVYNFRCVERGRRKSIGRFNASKFSGLGLKTVNSEMHT